MAEYDKRRVRAVGCPYCGAASGTSCVSKGGSKQATYHTARKAVVYPGYAKSGGAPKRGFRAGTYAPNVKCLRCGETPLTAPSQAPFRQDLGACDECIAAVWRAWLASTEAAQGSGDGNG